MSEPATTYKSLFEMHGQPRPTPAPTEPEPPTAEPPGLSVTGRYRGPDFDDPDSPGEGHVWVILGTKEAPGDWFMHGSMAHRDYVERQGK